MENKFTLNLRMYLMTFLSLITISAFAVTTPPAAPTLQPSGTQIRVNTTLPDDAMFDTPTGNYEIIFERRVNGAGAWNNVYTHTVVPMTISTYDASYVDTGLTDGDSYEYRVTLTSVDDPTDSVGPFASVSHNYTSFTGTVIISPNSKTESQINVHVVNQTTNASSFELQYSAPGQPTITKPFTMGFSEVNQVLTGLTPNTLYSIMVVAYDISGSFLLSNNIQVKTNRAKPDGPTFFEMVSVCPEKMTVQARFADPSQFDTWEMYLNGHFVVSGYSQAAITHEFTDLVPSGTYTVKLDVINETGRTMTVKQFKTTRYQAPFVTGLDVNDSEITDDGGIVRWQNNVEDWYCFDKIRDVIDIAVVFLNKDGTLDSMKTNASHNDATSFEVTGAGQRTWVGVYVRAFNETYVLGNWVGPRWFRTLGPPIPPTDLKATTRVDAIGDNEVFITWKDPVDDKSPEDAYIIEVSENGGDFKFISNINKDTEWFVHKPVQEGVTYTYRVKGSNKYGDGEYSEVLKHTLDFSKVPNAPYNVQGMVADNGIKLTWLDDSDKESAFSVRRSTDGTTWDEVGTTGMNVTWFVDETAASGSTYWYRVVAQNELGDSAPSEAFEITNSSASSAFVNVYPNPTVDGVNVRVASTSSTANVSLFDQSNRKVLEKSIELDKGLGRLQLNGLVPGAYQLIIKTDGQQVSRKIYKY